VNPVLTADTKLTDLYGGQGITPGSIAVSDGTSTRIIDISKAHTIGDVAGLIERNAPTGRRITARVTDVGLEVQLTDGNSGNLSIREVGGGTTAAQLGILEQQGAGTTAIVGKDLNPRLNLTTKLSNILGTRASAVLTSPNLNNNIKIIAKEHGAINNGARLQLVDDELLSAAPGLSVGSEVATYSATAVASQASVTWGDGPAGENDVIITAAQAGAAFNNVNIVLAKQTGLGAGNPTASYVDNGTSRTLTITIDDAVDTPLSAIKTAVQGVQVAGQPAFNIADDDSASGGDGTGSVSYLTPTGTLGNTGNSGGDADTMYVRIRKDATTANQVVAALQANSTITARFDIEIDTKDSSSISVGGSGAVDVSAVAVTAGGSGAEFDQDAGLQITNGGATHSISFNGAKTVEDLLNVLNGSQANVLAQINATGTGIDIRSRLSGSDFRIAENGGDTATQLGIRTFTTDTQLASLNNGIGVHTVDGTDFTIKRNDGTELAIDVSAARTVGDVLSLINQHPSNLDPSTRVVARLAPTGNGIELVDDNPLGTGQLRITRGFGSEAAWDLGLIPRGVDTATASDGPPPTAANTTVRLAAPNNLNTGLVITANSAGTTYNGVQVIYQNVAASGNQALVNFDSTAKTLTIDVDPLATTANTVLTAINAQGAFTATLENTIDQTNSGAGLIADTGVLGVTTGGSSNPTAMQATASANFAASNSALTFTAINGGTAYSDVTIEFVDDQIGDIATSSYNAGTKTLRVHIDATQTTANTLRQAVNDDGLFYVTLDRTTDLTNDGTGIVGTSGTIATTAGGTPEVITGRDPFTVEASGVFNSLLRLRKALEANDQVEISRAVGLLDDDVQRVNFVRADLGAKAQSLDTIQIRTEDETVELKSTLSVEIETDLVTAISDLTARQASFQASSQLMGKTFQLSLLDYL
ncbi:MAG TPA: hypothetical protein VL096_03940, partial [Pirellulaceae bacterium]|nr:hypothetical protein [Pirellulaceae bacterium]